MGFATSSPLNCTKIFAYLSLSLVRWDYSFYKIPKCFGDPEKVKKYASNPISVWMRSQFPNEGNC